MVGVKFTEKKVKSFQTKNADPPRLETINNKFFLTGSVENHKRTKYK